VPGGSDTSTIARTLLGAVPYGGEGVYNCKVPGTVAITYDDGPYIYTDKLLDLYAAYKAKATFFVTGINIGKGAIDNSATAWPAVIRRMYNEGHQVASHTWSHQDLSAITSQQRKDQMVRNEMAIRNIIGKFPTYMRPPYSSCTAASGCQADMETLGYVVSYFDLDTDGIVPVAVILIQY
jgi:peptidoglycan/xylan/chitin deacetylase (PgdA/CDA1 family)